MKTMKHRKLHNIAALFLIVAMNLGMAVPCMANQDENTIYIRTPEDLVHLSENCAYDEWSEGKTVVLSDDISLAGVKFEPIPYFAGTFDGNGYTISDFKVDGIYYPAGLFGITKQGALICNLTVTGFVMPEGSQSDVGGIVGINGGIVKDVTFSGIVSGQVAVGGIAGTNTETGVIENAHVQGNVFGEHGTGGVAGRNLGKIFTSENEAYVNNTSVDSTVSLDELNTNLLQSMYSVNSSDVMNTFTDSAGIAGYSSGMVISCKNKGTIGYPHVGYNAGGIAGRNTGFVWDCTNEGLVQGRKDIGGIVGQAEPFIDVQVEVSDLYVLDSQLSTLKKQIDSMTNSAENTADGVYNNLENVSYYLEQSIAEIEKFENGEFSEKSATELLADLTEYLNTISAELREAGTSMETGTDSAINDLRNVNKQVNNISDTLVGTIEKAKNFTAEDVIDDTSSADIEGTAYGKVADCVNDGEVYGDTNVGGIAGIMSVEHEADPEEDVTADISLEERKQYELKAILYHCINRGEVAAKKDGAAGICGRQDIGVITECIAYGVASSEDGDYVGGIAGLTRANVTNCIANCGLSGTNYVGGIVGSGYVMGDSSSLIENCYSLVKITDCQQFAGAIAGCTEGAFNNNFFVSEELAGINRVNYTGIAQQISYEELLAVPGMPEEIQTFTITFIADGQEVETLTFNYGDEIDVTTFPEVLKKKGYDGEWNINDLTGLCYDTEIEANYTLYVTSLESSDKRENLRPVVLAEGNFAAEDVLSLEAEEVTDVLWNELGMAGEVLEVWNINFSDDGQKRHTLRFLPADENCRVKLYVKGAEGWEKVETTEIGSYLAFDVSGTEAKLAVVSRGSDFMLLIVSIVIAVTLLSVFIFVGKKIKKKRLILIVFAIALLVGLGISVFYTMKPQIQTSMEMVSVMSELLKKEEQSAKLELAVDAGSNHIELNSNIYADTIDKKTIICLKENERPIYFYNNLIILENGKVFSIGEASESGTSLLEQIRELYSALNVIRTENGEEVTYAITAEGEDAKGLLNALTVSTEGQMSSASTVEVRLITLDGNLERIEMESNANLKDAMDTAISVEAVIYDFGEIEAGQWEVPEHILEAIDAAGGTSANTMEEEFSRLLLAWVEFYGRDNLSGTVSLDVECGPVNWEKEFPWAHLENGRESVSNSADVAKIPDILYEICLNGEYTCEKLGNRYSYQLTLDEEAIQNLANIVAPDIQSQTVNWEIGNVIVEVEENEIVSAKIEIDGMVTVLLSEVKASIGAEFTFSF